jgi:primosomal protein N' (replication factor Y)
LVVVYLVTDEGKAALKSDGLDPTQRSILKQILLRPTGMREATFHRRHPSTTDALAAMERKGWVTKRVRQGRRRLGQSVSPPSEMTPMPGAREEPFLESSGWIEQTEAGSLWRAGLEEAVKAGGFVPILLHAPLESRLSCLRRAVADLTAKGRGALVVTGEAERAKFLCRLITQNGGPRAVLLHGGLSDAERFAAWRTIQQGEAAVVVGTRSAVFAPLPRMGLVWIEGEGDPSLKEEQTPHYHAREVGWWRARQEAAVLVLASSHPSLETVVRVRDAGLVLGLPADQWGYPAVTTVNLREYPRGRILTPPMVQGIEDSLRQGTGAVLFLNRKGYGGALVCRDCGTAVQCSRCSVAATYYRRAAALLCHYCGRRLSPPETCAVCSASRLDLVGFGTERLEEDLRRLFPRIRLARLDREEAAAKPRSAAIVHLLRAGELDLVIGTQMLFQRGPLPRVGFVGIPYADAGLQVPDFRSAERTFGALLDALLLAKPAESGGRAVIQTLLPSHHAIAAAITPDSQRFYQSEAALRAVLGYPPLMHLVRLSVTGKDPAIVERAARRWQTLLLEAAASAVPTIHDRQLTPSPEPSPPDRGRGKGEGAVGELSASSGNGTSVCAQDDGPAGADRPAAGEEIVVLGPAPAPVPRVRGRYLWHLLVKSRGRELALRTVRTTLEQMERVSGVKLDVDVDPIQFT